MSNRRTSIAERGELVRAWAGAAWHPEALRADEPVGPESPHLREFVGRADAALGTPWPDALLSAYARYPRDGDREGYERGVFARMDRSAEAAVAALATGSPAHLDEVADGLQLLCEQSTWCWPAHDDVFHRTAGVVADPERPYLDLGAGEVAALFAWARLSLGDALDDRFPGLDRRMREEIRTRILDPFLERRDWHWLGRQGRIHNWNPWIHGNVIVAAAAFADPGEGRAIVDLAVDGIDRYLAALPADGAIDEGFGYWWNGAARALDALEVLERASGGTFDAGRLPGLAELLRFPLRVQLAREWVLGFSDAEPRPSGDQPWSILHRWGRRLGLDDVVAHARGFERGAPAAAAPGTGLGRILAALRDSEWTSAPAGALPLPASVVLDSLAVAIARERAGSVAGLTIALKGGHNDENHNHNDLGSVTVALDGVPAVIDVGRPTYDARTFGPDRYEFWTMRSDWHSVPEPRGALQHAGRHWRSGPISGADDGGLTARWGIDLTGAWELGDGERWTRGIRLDRGSSVAEVVDEWTLAPHPGTRTTWILWGEVRPAGTGRLLLRRPVDGARDVLIEHDAESVRTDERMIDDPVIARSWGTSVTRLRLSPRADVSSMTVRFRAAGETREESP
ncbi:hypothetical protein [Agromyces bauzanensis]